MTKVGNSQITRTITLLITIFSLSLPAYAKYSGGTGEPNDPYQIAEPNDWVELMNSETDWDKNFIMTADIDMNGISLSPVGTSVTKSFKGVFDGNDCLIYNADVNMPESSYIGIFGRVEKDGQISNISLENVTITGYSYIGVLVGDNSYGTVSNCYITGTVIVTGESNLVGGLLGRNYHGTVSNCYSTGIINGVSSVGGLVGTNYRGTISNCYSSGTVNSEFTSGGLVGDNSYGTVSNSCSSATVNSYFNQVGGLVGDNYHGTVSNCYSTGTVTGESNLVGGLVGRNYYGTISKCYNSGTVSGGYDRIGGLVGDNDGTISNCYSSGTVSGGDDRIGGLVGDNDGTISNCYSTGTVSGDDDVGGFVGINDGTLSNCSSNGSVSGSYRVGGLVGNNDETISNCYSSGTVSGGDDGIGGLVGDNDGTISNCYSTGKVSGDDNVGGFVGDNDGTISNCYSSGTVIGGDDRIGGLVGDNDGTISNCYSTGKVSGDDNVGGLVGRFSSGDIITCFWNLETSNMLDGLGNIDLDPNGAMGRTTSEMRGANTFLSAGWDFIGETINGSNDVWWILEGKDYPRLWWQLPEDDFNDCNATPLWLVYKPEPDWVLLEEINSRLEVSSFGPLEYTEALYISDGWWIDANQPFAFRVDFHYSKLDQGDGRIILGLKPGIKDDITKYAQFEIGSNNDNSYYSYIASDSNWVDVQTWNRSVDDVNGILYISYDPNSDELYFSNVDYGIENAVYTVTGLVKGLWQCEPLSFHFGGGSQDMVLTDEDAWLDNFVIDEGKIFQ